MARSGVFISHSHEDRDLAESLAALLRTALGLAPTDITCTSDAEFGLERGADLNQQITTRVTTAKALFLLATPASRKSDWVSRECGQADAERERGLAFYIVTPLSTHSDVIPAPYVGRVAVTMSQAEDLHTFVKQLRKDFGRTEYVDYSDGLVDLIDRSSRFENSGKREIYDVQTAEVAALKQRLKKQRQVLGAAAMILLVAVATLFAWVVKGERDHAAEIERMKTMYEADLSAKLNAAQMASDEEFRQFAFTGLLQDGQNRRVKCSRVEAHVKDDLAGGERVVDKDCDGSGAFAFSAPELRNDARIPIRLKVHVGQRPYELVVRLAEARLALLVGE
jgi:TIR domain